MNRAALLVGLAPVSRPDARLLILGSMPSAASLARGQYYANPRNAFWPLLGVLVGARPELAYAERLRRLLRARIALWDVVHRCRRTGSADHRIREVEVNDFAAFLAAHRRIEAVLLNGTTAAALFRRAVLGTLGERGQTLHLTTLPSTSPAHAAMSHQEKLRRWRAALRVTTP